jgi:hypothetical protein
MKNIEPERLKLLFFFAPWVTVFVVIVTVPYTRLTFNERPVLAWIVLSTLLLYCVATLFWGAKTDWGNQAFRKSRRGD